HRLVEVRPPQRERAVPQLHGPLRVRAHGRAGHHALAEGVAAGDGPRGLTHAPAPPGSLSRTGGPADGTRPATPRGTGPRAASRPARTLRPRRAARRGPPLGPPVRPGSVGGTPGRTVGPGARRTACGRPPGRRSSRRRRRRPPRTAGSPRTTGARPSSPSTRP